MPPPPGMELGPPPPDSPRILPKGYAFRIMLSNNLATMLGLILSAFGGLTLIGTITARSWGAVVPGCILLVGLSALQYGLKEARNTLAAFRRGKAVKGTVTSVRSDPTTRINGRHPWDIVYSFDVDGQIFEGKTQTPDAETSNRLQGRPPAWVLYVEDAPERNTIYPPVK